MPVAGALVLGIFALTTDMDKDDLALSTLVLSAIALIVGFIAMVVFSRSVSDPLRRLRDAFAAVEAGDLEAQVPVFDATEVGYAAAGFNRMVDGLGERERLRDLFGRQVGADVARRALEQGVTLGGEEREAAVLFVDIIGSTTFAADRSPTEVVDVLNEYTVIGDPVNEAARLTELAKERDGRLLASEAALERASRAEGARWELGDEVDLRGRTRPTRLAEVASG